jgi:hypothetical protein
MMPINDYPTAIGPVTVRIRKIGKLLVTTSIFFMYGTDVPEIKAALISLL